jgi:hypothetical protein
MVRSERSEHADTFGRTRRIEDERGTRRDTWSEV